MIKSETIEKISKILHLSRYDSISDNDLAKEILLEIEEAGMVPASYEGLMRNGEKFIRELHQGSDVMLIRNKWEPEMTKIEDTNHGETKQGKNKRRNNE